MRQPEEKVTMPQDKTDACVIAQIWHGLQHMPCRPRNTSSVTGKTSWFNKTMGFITQIMGI